MAQVRPRFDRHLHRAWAAALTATLAAGCVVDDDAPDEPPDPAASLEPATADPQPNNNNNNNPPQPPGPPAVTIDPRRSLVVTEPEILARFPLQRVLDQLVQQSGVAGMTSLTLFRQWWDTQNPGPGLGLGPHCDDVLDAAGQPTLNGFPYGCRPSEGAQAYTNPFVDPDTNPDAYVPIGLFNRFDLAPANGAHCGEYRIVYARRAGLTNPLDRNLVIFEAILPNPLPPQGLKGCRKIAEHWANLTSVDSLATRAARLEQFYFTGIPNTRPVIHVEHLGGGPSGAGQIRTNQFMAVDMDPLVWTLREYKLVRTCSGTTCTALRIVPAPVGNNPFGPLFSPTSTHPLAAAFRAAFLEQVPALAASTLPEIDVLVPAPFNAAHSPASGNVENNYLLQFGSGPSALRDAIQARLDELGSPLSPDDIVARAQALSCAGCHRLNTGVSLGGGLMLPSPIGFTHISERDTEPAGDGVRFAISEALTTSFLPVRKKVLEDYLSGKPVITPRPTDPIGRRRTH